MLITCTCTLHVRIQVALVDTQFIIIEYTIFILPLVVPELIALSNQSLDEGDEDALRVSEIA